MVQPRALTDDFSVSTQLIEADFAELASAGYKTIINNRPDGEEPGQLTASEAQKLAQAHGMNYVHIPVKMPELTSAIVEEFSTALAANPGPVLAHCKSGTRSCVLWTMASAQQNVMPLTELMQRAAQSGYDLTRMRPMIEQYINLINSD
ncbi:MAG: TIGR01244 family sulfur transferase [Cyanobacteria bacterium P01_F01_bin.56]